MNILYVAYSCSPCRGSEDKIGWNVPLESAKNNRVYVLTKEEHRNDIHNYLKEHVVDNISYHYVDLPEIYKRLFRGSVYSGRLNIWQRKAFQAAQELCRREQIDIIHQITPIEFRAIGDYGKIENIKFVCGPMGGGETLPKGLWEYTRGHRAIENIRMAANLWYRMQLRRNKKVDRCDYMLFANRETAEVVSKLGKTQYCIFFDNGVSQHELAVIPNEEEAGQGYESNTCTFLVAGRMAYRKGHRFLLEVLKEMPEDLNYQFRFVGGGPELDRLKELCKVYGLENRVTFTGRIPFSEMEKEYRNANVFVMPSIRETTGAVLLEAMSKGLPVVAINRFGSAVLLDETTGWLYDGQTKQEYIGNIRNILIDCITHPEKVHQKGRCAAKEAQKYLWENKVAYYQEIYMRLINQSEE